MRRRQHPPRPTHSLTLSPLPEYSSAYNAGPASYGGGQQGGYDPYGQSVVTVHPRKLAFPSTGIKEPGSAKRRISGEREVRTMIITCPQWAEGDFAPRSHPGYGV